MPPGRKFSKKREAILQVIRSTKEHPSAEWIYEKLKPEYPDLSLGTVYRNLALFREEGEIISIANVNGQERYDAETGSHPHFICRNCGAVIDVNAADPEHLDAALEKDTGFLVESHDLIFHGRCTNCIEKQAI